MVRPTAGGAASLRAGIRPPSPLYLQARPACDAARGAAPAATCSVLRHAALLQAGAQSARSTQPLRLDLIRPARRLGRWFRKEETRCGGAPLLHAGMTRLARAPALTPCPLQPEVHAGGVQRRAWRLRSRALRRAAVAARGPRRLRRALHAAPGLVPAAPRRRRRRRLVRHAVRIASFPRLLLAPLLLTRNVAFPTPGGASSWRRR